jgi:hypothetical protein
LIRQWQAVFAEVLNTEKLVLANGKFREESPGPGTAWMKRKAGGLLVAGLGREQKVCFRAEIPQSRHSLTLTHDL